MFRRAYDWVLHWAHTPYGGVALFLIAFAESSFFPIPPDVLLIALALSIPAKAFRFALICSIGSVLGGVAGYMIGYFLMESVGNGIIELYGVTDTFEHVKELFAKYDAWIVGIAGFTPIPYKVFTITSGAFGINFWVFLVASAISRSARFFILAFLLNRYGEHIKGFIEKYFGWVTIAFVVCLVGGFLLIKVVLHH